MSNMASGILGVVAGTLALGAVHLEVAAGNDLLGRSQRGDAGTNGYLSAPVVAAATPNVNRAQKGDRAVSAPVEQGVTISFFIPGVEETSVAMRVPSGGSSQKRSGAQPSGGTTSIRRPIACEPVVSVLTAVAKQLQPGRCVT